MSIKSCSKNTTHSFNISHLEKRMCVSPRAYILHRGTPRLPRAPPAHETSIVSVQKTVKIISRTGLLNRVQAPNFKRYKLPQLLHYIM